MAQHDPTTSSGGEFDHLNPSALARWLDEAGAPGAGEPLEIETLSGGSQNDLFLLRRGSEQMVLRRPPRIIPPGREDGMRREHRVMRALSRTDVPHPRLIAGSDDTDLMGAPFYVMERIEGWSPTHGWPAPFDLDLQARAGLAYELVRGAAMMARVDWRGVGLEGFGRPENFHERQVDRWTSFLQAYQFRDLPGYDVAADFLRRNRPEHFTPGIMHGDYQFPNVMFSPGAPAELAAVIDFEMTTVGDPLLDLGWVLIAWGPDGEDVPAMRSLPLEGMPSKDDLLEFYARESGLDTGDFDYYVVLARWKLAIVLEKSVARVRASGVPDPKVAMFDDLVLDLMRKAAELAQTSPLSKERSRVLPR